MIDGLTILFLFNIACTLPFDYFEEVPDIITESNPLSTLG